MYDFLGQQQPPKNIKVYSTDNRITIIRKWNFYINYGNLFLIIPPSIGLVMYVFELIQKYTLEKLIKDFIEVFFFFAFPHSIHSYNLYKFSFLYSLSILSKMLQ